jgi:hypothetical protein
MDDIYYATLLVSITFLSLVVPVFVFSVSLLGQALESAQSEREEAERKNQCELERKIEELKGSLDKAKRTSDMTDISKLTTKINKLKKAKKNALRKIERTSRALTVRGAVLVPGACFVAAVGSCAGARALRTLAAFSSSVTWGLVLWLFGLGFLGIGLFLFRRTLGVVQLVAVGSEETAHRRMIAAFKQAQKEVDEERLPKLKFQWKEEQPFVLSAGETRNLSFAVTLVNGYSAENVQVWFFASPQVEFPNTSSWPQESGKGAISGLTTTIVKFKETVMQDTYYSRSIEIQAPQEEGSFELLVQTECIGFRDTRQKFAIRVGDEEVPF